MELVTEKSVEEKFLGKKIRRDSDPKDTRCGLWKCQGDGIQFLASKKTFIVVYTLSAMLFTAGGAYTHGIISTIEKQYKLSSSKIGVIYALEDIISGIIAILIPYYTARGRFPRWIAFGVFLLGFSLLMQSAPFAIYGPGNDALSLTEEFSGGYQMNFTENTSKSVDLDVCIENRTMTENCSEEAASEYQGVSIIIAVASTFAGCGQQFFKTLGTTYLDNNIKNTKIPMVYSLFSFLRLLAPAIGFNTASYFLQFYVAPSLHPTIKTNDPRWIGAWWAGYLVFAAFTFILVPLMAMFPKVLPRAAMRRKEKLKNQESALLEPEVTKSSFADLFKTIKRLLMNKAYFCNTMAAIFYAFAVVPFKYFYSKYQQLQFNISPSFANSITGSVGFISSAIGLLLAGIVITIFKPRARYLAGWNIATSLIQAISIAMMIFISCPAIDNSKILERSLMNSSCNSNCNCDSVEFSPVCGSNGLTYISPCHAGCDSEVKTINGTKIFTNCSCVSQQSDFKDQTFSTNNEFPGTASLGQCDVDCLYYFYLQMIVSFLNRFINGTEVATNFLMGLRCVEERDKAISIALTATIIKFFAVIPSPIVFGYIFDQSCLLWGETCSETGNCWLYDTNLIKYTFNLTAATFVIIGMCWDIGTWYYASSIKIFDDVVDTK